MIGECTATGFADSAQSCAGARRRRYFDIDDDGDNENRLNDTVLTTPTADYRYWYLLFNHFRSPFFGFDAESSISSGWTIARIHERDRCMRTNLLSVGEPRGLHKPLCKVSIYSQDQIRRQTVPEVLLMRKRALVRLASPSILRVPMKDVLIVLTALYW